MGHTVVGSAAKQKHGELGRQGDWEGLGRKRTEGSLGSGASSLPTLMGVVEDRDGEPGSGEWPCLALLTHKDRRPAMLGKTGHRNCQGPMYNEVILSSCSKKSGDFYDEYCRAFTKSEVPEQE